MTFLRYKQYNENALETDYSNAKLESNLESVFSLPTTVDREL